ncbi:hypothetical protein RSC3_04485 [Bacillus paralicheniformis]|nr:hypothetical protein RSC3_04485 [Bacillus paralicheniformis]
MKKLLIPFMLLLTLMISACGNEESATKNSGSTKKESKTITYQAETGPIEVPADPQRVVMLSGYTGNVLDLGVNVVGVDTWSKNNPTFKEKLKDVQEVSEDDLEKIIELEPDLIIALSTVKNLDKLNEIAPTVTYTWGKVDYLTQHVEIGKLLNKEKKPEHGLTTLSSGQKKSVKIFAQKSARIQLYLLLKHMGKIFMFTVITGRAVQKSYIKR